MGTGGVANSSCRPPYSLTRVDVESGAAKIVGRGKNQYLQGMRRWTVRGATSRDVREMSPVPDPALPAASAPTHAHTPAKQ